MTQGQTWEVSVWRKDSSEDPLARGVLQEVSSLLKSSRRPRVPVLVTVADNYFFQGKTLTEPELERVAAVLLHDPVTQSFQVGAPGVRPGRAAEGAAGGPGSATVHEATVLKKPGVMDPVEGSLLEGLADLGLKGVRVRTARRFTFHFPASQEESAGREALQRADKQLIGEKVLSNPAIESVHWEDDPAPLPFQPGVPFVFKYREIPLAGLSDEELLEVSRKGQLSLNRDEMVAIRDYFGKLGRAPSDAELETLAQTWSEHCCHKTFTGIIEHHAGAPQGKAGAETVERIDNLMKATVRKATEDLNRPWCLSVFEDNAGVIEFDDEYGLSFKVETHNHPSAIEPYGGAGTGIGGVLRDTVGTGLGAKPIINTDIFCFGPPDLPLDEVPPGALHPLRVLKGVVSGVRDYGNRMGIPTANGAVYFDRRYIGNPLVYCGSVGIIPRGAIRKSVQPRDRIYVLGGRTGRDGIHGATFSSVELTEESETVSSGAVQIGNAITEKKLFDVILQARDRRLYRGITDCGAGGLSSAVGEMGEGTGASVHLERVPLKYEGLSYWEIWISEAQERMVVAVPPERARELEELAAGEDVECTDIGEFTDTGRLVLWYEGHQVCDLEMSFLHGGRPRWERRSVLEPHASAGGPAQADLPRDELGKTLRAILASPNVASKEWIIRQYDHEVQGQSVLKPLVGVEDDGPGDAAVFCPRPGSRRGVVIGCGMNPRYGDLDPYRMALSAVDEAVRNVIAAGADVKRIALLDNFCWGNTDRPEVLGSLVEAAKGCHAAAVAYGTPFISGKDSLRNEYRVGDRMISIPPSLLISSISVLDDVEGVTSMDLKQAGNRLVLVGETRPELGGSHWLLHLGIEGGEVPGVSLQRARKIHEAVCGILRRGYAVSCHDLSEGGLGAAVAEMAFAGMVGAEVFLQKVPQVGCESDGVVLFSESNSRYLLEVPPAKLEQVQTALGDLPSAVIGETTKYAILRVLGCGGEPVVAEALGDLKGSWKDPLQFG